ncbi:MAG: histidine kinase [Lapillicoccus sp.]
MGHVMAGPVGRWVAAGTLFAAALVPNLLYVRLDSGWPSWAPLAAQVVLGVSAVLLAADPSHRRSALLLGATVVALGASGLLGLGEVLGGGYWNQVGWAAQWWAAATLLPVLLSYPGDRLGGRGARTLVWTTAAVVASRTLAAPTWSTSFIGDSGPTLWATYPGVTGPELSRLLVEIETVGLLAVVVWATVLLVRRGVAANGLQRRAVRAVVVAGLALALAVGVRQISDAAWPVVLPGGDVIRTVTFVLLGVAPVVLLVIAVRDIVQRARLVDSLLRHGGDAAAVEATLRTALHDSRLRLHFAIPGGWADASGRLVAVGSRVEALPEPLPGLERRLLPPGGSEGGSEGGSGAGPDAGPEVGAVIDLSAVAPEDEAAVGAVLTAAALATENSRLGVERTAHLRELSASRTRVVEAGLQERHRLERDLHDGVQQHLLALSATLSRAELAGSDAARSGAMAEARLRVAETMSELRSLARGIHPTVLSQGGLGVALPRLESVDARVHVEVDPALAAGMRLDPTVEAAAYFAVAELVANAVKHSGARRIRVAVSTGAPVAAGTTGATPDPGLRLLVEDDGACAAGAAGTAGAPAPPQATAAEGGLLGVRDRVASLGGRLRVDVPATGGSVVDVWLPHCVTEG